MNSDLSVEKFFMDNVKFFEHVHPNVVSGCSIGLNILIYKELSEKKIRYQYLCVLFVLRWLTDILDGSIARRYNKKSKLGGALDTIADYMLFIILFDFVAKKYNLSTSYYCAFITMLGFNLYYNDSISCHDSYKTYNEGSMNIIPFFVNNSSISYIILFVIIYYVMEHSRLKYKYSSGGGSHTF
ncbi:MAG: CDP-alcohol phosphatidyltransferase family protein [Candidatus Colwellbacteria bacterium]|nr:CDP-alcohol phosphatidyltransferase family protein [Candidatus Colwellbacteria bacterium]